MRPVAVVGAAALARHGSGWRGLGEAIARGTSLDAMPDEQPLANPRARKMMSRGAYLAARCLHDLVAEVGWDVATRERAGYYLGVGASGGSLADVTALLDASIVDHQFSTVAFGERGLAACNPLLAFQLMNNFTLCHGAILEGIGGPNSALFSRGAGTVAALLEAVHAIRDGECDHAIAGGADSALHPVTQAELSRDGFVERGLVPTEGAGLLGLSAMGAGLATIEGVAVANGTSRGLDRDRVVADGRREDVDVIGRVIDDAVTRARGLASKPVLENTPTPDGHETAGHDGVDVVVIAPWGPPAADLLATWARARHPNALVVDLSLVLGNALAASPALAWIAALDLLGSRRASRALVVSLGTDGDLGVVMMRGAT
ncbi:MAG TPA: beta-ketoacyl synthase N-terminal-like domain-containing protein [Kofleriaceae bacterium]